MKRGSRNILAPMLLAFYIMASMGIGVHECSMTGSIKILIFSSSKSCDAIHPICSCKHHHHDGMSEHMHHSAKCCHTTIHNLDQGYDVAHSHYNLLSPEVHNFIAESIPDGLRGLLVTDSELISLDGYAPPPLIKDTNSCLFHSQWRL